MGSINDNILNATGGPTINEGLGSWYGQSSNQTLNDALHSWLKQRPYAMTYDHVNDMWFEFLRADGYTGALNDMLAAYWAAPSRVIPTFAGSQYGTLDTTFVAAAGDTVEIQFATISSGVAQMLIDGDIATDRSFVQFTAGDVINFNTAEISTLTVDGVAATSLVTAAPNDGKVHTIIATLAVGARISKIGVNFSVSSNHFIGQILSVKIALAAGTTVSNYVFDSGSTTAQYARGSTTDKVTLINFSVSDWTRYTLQRNILHDAGTIVEAWVGADSVVNGTFDTDTDWIKGTGWSISGGEAHCDGSQAGDSDLYQDLTAYFAQDSIVLASYDQTAYSAGASNSVFGGAPPTIVNATIDTFTRLGAVGAFAAFGIRGDVAFTGSIDNIKIKQLLEVA